ncbi:hypothetical protein KCU83_g599, partial [Aureobasidium melanogenum]
MPLLLGRLVFPDCPALPTSQVLAVTLVSDSATSRCSRLFALCCVFPFTKSFCREYHPDHLFPSRLFTPLLFHCAYMGTRKHCDMWLKNIVGSGGLEAEMTFLLGRGFLRDTTNISRVFSIFISRKQAYLVNYMNLIGPTGYY